jgi:hypothetical protein
MVVKKIVKDDLVLPCLILCEERKPDECTPNQLFALCQRGWIILATEGDGRGGILLYASLTLLGQREAAMYRKTRGLPPRARDESGPTT